MAWPNLFRIEDENTRTCWNYTFQWTKDHLTPAQMTPMKYSYDELGEQALNKLNMISPPPGLSKLSEATKQGEMQNSSRGFKKEGPKRDLCSLLREHAATDAVLGQLWTEVNTVPSWVCWEQIARGQECFYRYGGPALTGLAFQSLLGGMGATRVVEVLSRTGGFSTKVARKRLFETTQHILQCTQSLPSIQPGGAGHASSIRVRLLHAAVRQKIMKLARQKPEYYDVEKNGIPINDLDCVATIGTFSATLIWLSFPRQGIWMRHQEVVDLIALWRYIGYLTGTPTDFFETPGRAKKVMESLLLHEIDPSETSKILANNILKSLKDQPPGFASKPFLEVNCRWLNGNALCDSLGLGRPGIYYWALMAGQCLFFMAICYSYRAIPYLDKRKIAALRRIFWSVVIESKNGLGEETTFEFQYIPDLSREQTQMEDATGTNKKPSGIERRNLQALMIGCGLLCGVAYLTWKTVSALTNGFRPVLAF